MDYAKAFLVGGILCLIGQILIDKTMLTPARILVGYVVAGVILGAVGVYQPIVDFAGAGIPICIASLEHRNALEQRGSNYYQCVSTQSTHPRQALCQSLCCGEPDCCKLIAVAYVLHPND